MLSMVGIQNTDPAAQVLATRSGVALWRASLTLPPPAATTGHHTNKANTDIGAGVGPGRVGPGRVGRVGRWTLCRAQRGGVDVVLLHPFLSLREASDLPYVTLWTITRVKACSPGEAARPTATLRSIKLKK